MEDKFISRFEPLSEKEKKALQKHSSLILQIELVPRSCWMSNIRSNLKNSQWDKIRFKVYDRGNNLCEICGERGTQHAVECHEIWTYDDVTLKQTLSRFQALCPLCHEVKHMSLARMKGNGERAFKRFREINKLNAVTAKSIESAVCQQWTLRSERKWELDIEHLREYNIDLSTVSIDREP